MKLVQALSLALIFIGALAGRADCIFGWENTDNALYTDAPVHNFGFEVDSIDFRPDLTRIYGKISGTPHIAINVKQIVLSTDGHNAFTPTDTDGLELDKYFQFEEMPTFNVEFDFEPMTPSNIIKIVFLTANGSLMYQYSTQ